MPRGIKLMFSYATKEYYELPVCSVFRSPKGASLGLAFWMCAGQEFPKQE